MAWREQLARTLARGDQCHRAGPGAGGTRDRAVGGPPVYGRSADHAADPWNTFRQPAFRSAVRRRITPRSTRCDPLDGTESVRTHPDLSRRQPRALARLLRVLAAAVRV